MRKDIQTINEAYESIRKPFVNATEEVLSEEQNEPKPIKHSDVKAGDTVEWYNGPITFREKVFEKDGKLYVAGTPRSRPILVSSIRLQLHLAQKGDTKAFRAADRTSLKEHRKHRYNIFITD